MPDGVNLCGYFEAETGLGQGVRRLLHSLETTGLDIACNNVRVPWYQNSMSIGRPFQEDSPHPITIVHVNPDYLHALPPSYLTELYTIAFWNWELCSFPAGWMKWLDCFDEIWAPSVFTTTAIAAATDVPVHWVPYSIETHESGGPERVPSDRFLFLFAFDLYSFVERKNPTAVLAAFRQAFGPHPTEATLLIKVMHADKFPVEYAALQQACGDGVVLQDGVMDTATFRALLSRCDAYVSLHRSEGFGFPIYEAMAAGKPVLATDYSGNIDFMDGDNSCPVDFRLAPLHREQGPYRMGTPWADADIGQAADWMRHLVADRALGSRLGQAAQRDVRRYLSEARMGDLLKMRLKHSSTQTRRQKTVPVEALKPAPPSAPRAPLDFMSDPIRRLIHFETDGLRQSVERLASSQTVLHEEIAALKSQQRRQAGRLTEALERPSTVLPDQVDTLILRQDVLQKLRPIEVWKLLEQTKAETLIIEWDAARAALLAEARSLDFRGTWPHSTEGLRFMLSSSGFYDIKTGDGFLKATGQTGMKFSIIVCVYNNLDLTRACLDSLQKEGLSDTEVLVIDDASTDTTPQAIPAEYPWVRFHRHEPNLGYGGACTWGAGLAAGEYLILLNNDTVVEPQWLAPLYETLLARPKAGMVCARLLYPDRTLQHCGMVFTDCKMPYHIYRGFHEHFAPTQRSQPYQAINGAGVIIPRTLFEQVGGFDTRYRNGFEDVDQALRLRTLGYELWYEPRSTIIHFESKSPTRFKNEDQNQQQFLALWADKLESDFRQHYQADGFDEVLWPYMERFSTLARPEDFLPLHWDIGPATPPAVRQALEALDAQTQLLLGYGLTFHEVEETLPGAVGIVRYTTPDIASRVYLSDGPPLPSVEHWPVEGPQQLLGRSFEIVANRPDSLLQRGRSLLASATLTPAYIEQFEVAYPQQHEPHLLKGDWLWQQGQPDQALDQYQQVLDMVEPAYITLRMADTLRRRDETDQALAHLARLLGKQPLHLSARLLQLQTRLQGLRRRP